MEEIHFTDRADFAIAEVAGEAERAEAFLDMARVVVWFPEEMPAASVATAQAAAVNRPNAP